MKLRALLSLLALAALTAIPAHAQWRSTTFTLKGGWNSIYLPGDATHATPDTLFASYPAVQEVWRWNPNPNQVQFISTPLQPTEGTPEWSVWRRGSPDTSTLTLLTGQTAYLVKVDAGVSTLSVTLQQRPLAPRATWVRNGANLLGFPAAGTGATSPTFASYFAAFPAPLNAKVFKYTGSELSASNPLQIFSTAAERIDRNQAYWFEVQTVETFHGPIEVTLSGGDTADFGRLGSVETIRLRNRTSTAQTVTLALQASEAAPQDQEAIAGTVPLTRRTFDAGTASWVETPIAGSIVETIAPGATAEVQLGVSRVAMHGANNTLYASLLRVTDAANVMDAWLPVRARVAGLEGLWVGDAEVSGVSSTAPGAAGTGTARAFPLRFILHVDGAGTARVLSQAFTGTLAATGNPVGVATRETALKADEKASARRYVSTHMPLDRAITGSGSFGLGGAVSCTVGIPFNDPTSPFVHQYHPDHDNRNARFQPVGAGVESFDVSRAITFNFAATPPAGTSSIGWGTIVVGGSYAETITGLHKQPLSVTGTFTLRRVSDIGAITLD